MPIYMNIEGIKGSITTTNIPSGYSGAADLSGLMGRATMTPGASLSSISNDILKAPPANAGAVLIGASSRPGWCTVPITGDLVGNRKGIIAILIGLLLPAVQNIQEEAKRSTFDPNCERLQLMLKGNGGVLTVGEQGLLSPCTGEVPFVTVQLMRRI